MSPRTYRPGDPEYFHATPLDSDAATRRHECSICEGGEPCKPRRKPDSDAREVRSPEYDALLRQAVEENQAEKRKLAAMTPAQRDEYIREWAARIAPGLCAEATAHDREMNAPWISLPLSLAQRVLAALDRLADARVDTNYTVASGNARALAAELRAVIGK